jgi:hypothetical protein
MAEKNDFYTEGGMPSNRQVAGVRNTRVYSTDARALVAADLYNLFELDTREVILQIGVDVLTAAAAGTAAVTIDGTAVPGLTVAEIDLTSTGKVLSTFITGTTPYPAVLATGATVEITFTGTTEADVNVFALVMDVTSPETFTKVDTPAP